MNRLFSASTVAGNWLGFVTAIWVQAIAGNNYTFANYSNAIKSLMHLNQVQLNNLSVAKDIGKAFGILAGLASDRLPTAVILMIGSVEGLVGYGVQWLVVSRRVHPLPYWQMCIFLAMGGNSTTWMNTAVLVTCFRNFRKNRGPVSGILKGYIGLSTAIFTDLCTALFSSSPASFLLMLALVPAAVCLASALFLRESAGGDDHGREDESRYFALFNAVAVVVALYLLVFDVTGAHGHAVSAAFAAGLLALLASPLSVPVHAAVKSARSLGRCPPDVEGEIGRADGEAKQEDGPEKCEGGPNRSGERPINRKPIIGEDHNILQVIRSLDFWCLFASFLCGVGPGMAVLNNMGQIGVALGHPNVSVFVSLMSILGFFGRIGSGTISEYCIKRAAVPRPAWNAASQVLITAGYFILAAGMAGSPYVGAVIVGFCYGVRIAVTVPTASELFGLKYYGLIYNILILNLPLGSFLFSGLLAGMLYDARATPAAGGGNTCVGAHCYKLTFLIMAAVSVAGIGLDMVLVFRTKKLYSRICMSKKVTENDERN